MMESVLPVSLNWSDWLNLFQHFCTMSLLTLGGAIGTVPEMHRYLVEQHHWLSETQFNASIALGQASPGPNVLFVVLLGWNIGVNSGGSGLLGLLIAIVGILLPSTVLTLYVSGWLRANHSMRSVRAFKLGLAPIVIALLIATGWIMASSHPKGEWHLWVITILTALVVWQTRIHLLWLLTAGALLGWFGWI